MEDFEKVFPEILQKVTHSGEKQLDRDKIKKIDQLTRQWFLLFWVWFL